MRFMFRLLLPLVVLALTAVQPGTTQAQEEEYGYLWSLEFPFEKDFNGVLTIEVGPWANGDLLAVDATSTAIVPCTRVGAVQLNGGDAVFNGGHLSCTFDLAAVVARNHGLTIPATDSYGSILFVAELEASVPQLSPIFVHRDATYTVDFSQFGSVTLAQDLDNQLGAQQAQFPNSTWWSRVKYTMEYGCVWMGQCGGLFRAGAQGHNTPPGGSRLNFTTGRQTFLIGAGGGAAFQGRLGRLLIDPGNTVH